MSREQLIDHLSSGRSAYDPAPPGLWEAVADVMIGFADDFDKADARRRFLETSPEELFSDYSGARRRLLK